MWQIFGRSEEDMGGESISLSRVGVSLERVELAQRCL